MLKRCADTAVGPITSTTGPHRSSYLPTLDPAFFQVIIDHPVILPVLEHFLDTTMILGSLSSRIVRPGDGQQDFHGDIPENMLNLTSPVMMNTVWMRTSAPRSEVRGSCPALTRAVWPGLPWRQPPFPSHQRVFLGASVGNCGRRAANWQSVGRRNAVADDAR